MRGIRSSVFEVWQVRFVLDLEEWDGRIVELVPLVTVSESNRVYEEET
jgi:hypothetical protein